jgi:fluoride exporter
MIVVWIACARNAGPAARFVLERAIRHRRAREFPWATVLINVSVETIRLIQRRRYWAGPFNAMCTLLFTVPAAAVGKAMASL